MSEVIRCQGSKICSPFLSSAGPHGAIYYVSAGTGEVFLYNPQDQSHTSVLFTGGEPHGACFDDQGRLHVADCGHGAVLRVDDHGQPGVMVKVYEEKAFRGPSSLAFGENDSLYFTDSGPFGETTLERPRGSIFFIGPSPSGGRTLRPLAMACLAHPSGIAVSPSNPKIAYVTEQMNNRILRIAQRPSSTHHLSVFYQLAGGIGPSCIACDTQGCIYVGHFDFSGPSRSNGRISVISSDGVLLRTIEVPGCEITGICISLDGSSIIVTEASANAIHRIPLQYGL